MTLRTLLLSSFAVALWLPGRGAAQDSSDPEVSAVAAAWKKRLDGAPPLSYDLAGKWVTFPPAPGNPLGPPGKTPNVLSIERKLLVDWPTGKYRKETKDQTSEGYETLLQVYNGAVIQGRRGRLLPTGEADPAFEPKVGIGKGDLAHATFPMEYWPLFFAAGVVPSTIRDDYYPGHMKFSLALDMWKTHGRERIEGRDCIVLRTFPSGQDKRCYEVVVDPSRDGAILRLTGLIDQRARFLNLSIHWKQTAFGWQPSDWRHEKFRDGALASYHEMTVDRVQSAVVSKADFEILPAEKELVVRNTYSGESSGSITEQELLQQRNGGLVPVEIVNGEVRRKWTWRTYVFLGVGVIAVGGLLFWLQYRRRLKYAG
jgi:hypothetical protein